ncbi:MAG TPA: hypothetical protein VGY55_03840, partial [Pirellulales bacterium]|nr:hypothetical protein [Pirellulales bacterium]
LTRDELPGFVGVVERQHNGDLPRMGAQAAPDGAASVADAAETAGAKPRSAAPLLGRGGRAPRRNRRAL